MSTKIIIVHQLSESDALIEEVTVDMAQLEHQIHLVVGDIDEALTGQFHLFGVGKLQTEVALHLTVLERIVEEAWQEMYFNRGVFADREFHLDTGHLQFRKMAADVVYNLFAVAVEPDVNVTWDA